MIKAFISTLLCLSCTLLGNAPAGSWISSISAEKIAEGAAYILNLHAEEEYTYWCELRPQNEGRYTLVRLDRLGKVEDLTPSDFSVRTFVHEYGGGAFTVSNGIIYASRGEDNAVYRICPGKTPERITSGQTRFADFHKTSHGLVAVGEHHESDGSVNNFLALIDLNTGDYIQLASGYDFYASPTLSADGKKIAWLCWNHPEMPWTHTELWVADIDETGKLHSEQQIAGHIAESIFQPQWSPEGILYFVTDREKGWWNVHCYREGAIENLCPIEAEAAQPLWNFEMSTYAFLEDKIVFACTHDGIWDLILLDPKTKNFQLLRQNSAYTHQVRGSGQTVRFLEEYANKGHALIQIDSALNFSNLKSGDTSLGLEDISLPIHVAFPSNGRIAYGFYYPPKNQHYCLNPSEKPPLIVMIHGGPTWQTTGTFLLGHQFWTNRGFAILDVNYGGSSGYGRDYRDLLKGEWGVVDVEDCVNGAQFLAQKGLADENKLAIRGGSAGGYTTLAALAFKDIFKAGASYYGVADITALTQQTHKFESHYDQYLIGKYPEKKELWESRSPIHSVDSIHVPLILFHGDNDRVVDKNQSIMIYDSLKMRGVPVEIHIYPDEDHGFRQAKHIIHSLNCELDFYLKAFGLKKD